MRNILKLWQRVKREHQEHFATVPVVVRSEDEYVSFDEDASMLASLLGVEQGNFFNIRTEERHTVVYMTSRDVERLHNKLGIVIIVESTRE